MNDDVARTMISHHIAECDKRMVRIEYMFSKGDKSRRGLHVRINALIGLFLSAALTAAIYFYQQNEAMKMERINSFNRFNTQAGESTPNAGQ